MPNMNGFQLCEKILELDANIIVCFMTALEVNIQALREIYPNISFGCFIEKPVSIKYLIQRVSAELDQTSSNNTYIYVAMAMFAKMNFPVNKQLTLPSV